MRRPVKTRKVVDVDSKYGSVLVNRLINQIMRDGKKSTARQIVYSAMLLAEEQLKKPALEVVETAMENAGPQLELRSRRIGGANYQVPYEVRTERKMTLALRWIVGAAR